MRVKYFFINVPRTQMKRTVHLQIYVHIIQMIYHYNLIDRKRRELTPRPQHRGFELQPQSEN